MNWLWVLIATAVIVSCANTFALAFVGCRRALLLGFQWYRFFYDSERYLDETWFWSKTDERQEELRRRYPGRFEHIPRKAEQ